MKILPEIIRVLTRGPYTEKYPRVESPPAPGYRGRVKIDPEKCVGCGTCARACPTGAIVLADDGGTRRVEVLYGRCILCGKCAEVCPYEAVGMSEEYEHYSSDPNARVSEVSLELKRCRLCGGPIAPTRLVEEIEGKLREEGLEDAVALLDLCPSCREKLLASMVSQRLAPRPESP